MNQPRPQISSTHGWAGTLPSLVEADPAALLDRLLNFVPDASQSQIRAWQSEITVLQAQGTEFLAIEPRAHQQHAVLEYTLPREAGRRPDVLVLQSGQVAVIEFKESSSPKRSDLDQVAAYARDLAHYHTACEGLDLHPILVLCGADREAREIDGVQILSPGNLASHLRALSQNNTAAPVGLKNFLEGEYAPLPSLVAAARLLFENLPLPQIRRARSSRVHHAVESILALARRTRAEESHQLALVTGVPGAGKTLVGLQVAHSAALEEGFRFGSRRTRGAPATFLSGNGPLVQVLQDALKSRAFVQDMHRFVREYGLEHTDRVPTEHIIVFDEAQRAWDGEKIRDFYGKKLPGISPERFASEPALLTQTADRMPHGALVVALVGGGQEIHTGEEAGMVQWAEALQESDRSWSVTGPPAEAALFRERGIAFHPDSNLNLDIGLRYHAAADLHRWIELVLDENDLDAASYVAKRLRKSAFPIYITRDLLGAKGYLRERFAGERGRWFGILASSKSERCLERYDLPTGFQATRRIKIGSWFNADPSDSRSCCQLEDVITEFQCQGLELDLALVCWADDFYWTDGRWTARHQKANRLIRNPQQLRTNAYRVLLSRSREGLVIFVPDQPAQTMDPTYDALVRAGAVPARAAADQVAVLTT